MSALYLLCGRTFEVHHIFMLVVCAICASPIFFNILLNAMKGHIRDNEHKCSTLSAAQQVTIA